MNKRRGHKGKCITESNKGHDALKIYAYLHPVETRQRERDRERERDIIYRVVKITPS